MFIDSNIFKYIIYSEETILRALEKISKNKMRIVFAVSEDGVLDGLLTDGDFRHWILGQEYIDLHQPVYRIINRNFVFARKSDPFEKIHSLFTEGIEFIPLLDAQGRLVSVASLRAAEISIDKFLIGDTSPAFIIAEIGNNHNGSLEYAKKLIDMAVYAEADCAKFQMRNLKKLYKNAGDAGDCREDLGTQYTLDLLSRFQLSDDDLFRAFDYCRKKDILPLCTPWDEASVESLERYGMQAYKVASADLTNPDLLTAIASRNKPMLCSTGMAMEREIIDAVSHLGKLGAMYVLLQCNSTYPAPYKDINLRYMKRLKEIGNCPVGYSGHELGISVPIAAVAMGAKVIEKHFTLDKNMEGNDHRVSLLPDEFKRMVQGIREVELALGSNRNRRISQGELINRENLAKSLVINTDLPKGGTIQPEMIEVRSPGKGLPPYRKPELIGIPAKRDFKAGDFFYPSDVQEEEDISGEWSFGRRFGIPVRFHDAMRMARMINCDLLEFHLSYKDLEEKIGNFFKNDFPHQLVVHSPELFAGDHILDLCSEDETYRERSIAELQKVIDLTGRLGRFFPNTEKPPIVVNVGGFSMHDFLPRSKRAELYRILHDSLDRLDAKEAELIPQTMPPFPWHFGGRRFHNLFMDAEEIVSFCKERNSRICLDTSHSWLACNHFKWSFREFIAAVAPFAAHLHIADAEGEDGEGLQIGEGEIDFGGLFRDLDEYCPEASFIPEIWQGHKDDGRGFRVALERLQGAWVKKARP